VKRILLRSSGILPMFQKPDATMLTPVGEKSG